MSWAQVSGGSIGLAIAEGLAAEDVDVVIAARNVQRIRGEVSRIRQVLRRRAEGWLATLHCGGTDALIADVGRRFFGGADILINNAGTGSNKTVMEAPDEK